ncbi:MAG: DegV family protein [Breznakia sp.]
MKIAFVGDSGTGLSISEIESAGCFSVPLQITYDTLSKLENEDISVDEVNALMKAGKLLKTSLAPLGKMEILFQKLKDEGYDMVFAVPICRGLSGTIDAMQMVANNVGIAFTHFDCQVTAVVEQYMLIRAKALYDEKKSIEEIKTVLQKICDTTNTLLIPNDLQHLKRGGRLTPLAATLGGLLKIKPILQIGKKTSGKIDVLDKVRTMSRALDRTLEVMKEEIATKGKNFNITVAHVASEEAGKDLLHRVELLFPEAKVQLLKLVSSVSVHTGIGCLAIQYFKEY